MTLSLAYNDDLGRVQITASGLPDIGAVRVERSVNGLLWTTVRGASALTVEDGSASVDDYEFVADQENHYRVVSDTAGLNLPGTLGSYAATPDDPALRITGDVVLTAFARLDQWSGAPGNQILVSRYDAMNDQRSYQMVVQADGRLRLNYSTNGVTVLTALSHIAINAPDEAPLAVRAWLDVDLSDTGTTRRVIFLTSPTGEMGTWEQLGTVVDTAGVVSLHEGTAPLHVGSASDGASPVAGRVFWAHVWDGGLSSGDLAVGTTVADPVFTDQPTDTTSFTDTVDNLWTVEGDARIIGGTIYSGSITPSLSGKAWLKSIKHPFLNRPIHRVLAGGGQDIGRAWRGGIHEVQGRSAPIAVTDIRSSREFTLTVQVPDEQAAAEMDLILASGDVFFIQVPPELAPHMAGGYVRIGATSQHRVADTIMWRFTLPCKVVAPPGPGVIGAPLTWGTVFNLYGSYEAMWAANPTWADLLSTVGSPDDLVVLP